MSWIKNFFVHNKDSDSSKDITVRQSRITLDMGGATKEIVIDSSLDIEDLSTRLSSDSKMLVAAKISRLLPDLIEQKQLELIEYALNVVRNLCEDQLPKVRSIISEELKENRNIPRELMLSLAWDKQYEVYAPVLEFSPVLTDDDLIEIITFANIEGVSEAIAKRRKLSQAVSYVVVRKGSDTSVKILLENRSASISDDTMVEIADKAEKIKMWQKPLITRPELSMRVISRIATYITESQISSLVDAGILKASVAVDLRNAVAQRLSSHIQNNKAIERNKVNELDKRKALTPTTVQEALAEGNREFVVHGLAKLAGVKPESVEDILKTQSPSIISALVWKAGLPMRSSTFIQLKFASIHHGEILYPKNGSDFPLPVSSMEKLISMYLDN